MANCLHRITKRACTLFPSITPSEETIRHLSVISDSLGKLSSSGGCGISNRALIKGNQDCLGILCTHLQALGPAESVSAKSLPNIFSAIKSSSGVISKEYGYRLFLALDRHVSAVQFTTWKPSGIISAIHTITKISPHGNLEMIDELLFCAQYSLTKFSEKQTALLLWCLAMMGPKESHLTLWNRTCQRCQLLFSRMNHISRAIVLRAILMKNTEKDPSHEEQVLRQILFEKYLSSNPEDPSESDEQFGANNAEKSPDSKLLVPTLIKSLPHSFMVQMIERAGWEIKKKKVEAQSSLLSDNIAAFMKHLTHQPLNPNLAADLLKSLKHFNSTDELISELRGHVLKILFDASPTAFDKPEEVLIILCSQISSIHPSNSTTSSSMASESLVEPEDTTKGHIQTMIVALLTRLCVNNEHGARALDDRYVLALALGCDALARSGGDASVGKLHTLCTKRLGDFPVVWETLDPSRCAEYCASVFFFASRCDVNMITSVTPSVQSSHLAQLFSSCEQWIVSQPRLSVSTTLLLLQSIENLPKETLQMSFESFLARLISHLGNQADTPSTLREVADLLFTSRLPLPIELLDFYLRILMRDATSVKGIYIDAVLNAFEQLQGDCRKLESGFMLLLTRRLGESTSFLEKMHIPPYAIRQLVNYSLEFDDSMTRVTVLGQLVSYAINVVLPKCSDVFELVDIISLFGLVEKEEIGLTTSMQQKLTAKAVTILTNSKSSKPSNSGIAYLVAHIIRAGIPITQDLTNALDALRKK